MSQITGKFVADFSAFATAVAQAETQLKGFETESSKVETALNRIGNQFSGRQVISEATLMAKAIEDIGGTSKLTASELERAGNTAQQAVEKMRALGIEVPAALDKLAAEATGTGSAFERMGEQFVATLGGMVSAEAILDALKTGLQLLGQEIVKLTVDGGKVAGVAENFDRLAMSAGHVGETLLGQLRAGTHGTVSDFDLMVRANQNLAAGLNLTDQQFGQLAQGAFALSRATGVDVKEALDKMNDAMLTGRTRAIALLTGKIDLKQAEEVYAESLGRTAKELTADEKLEAAREAILRAVGAATERLGAQTETLDVTIKQAQVTWANFEEELGKTVATSPVMMTAINGIKQALTETFGGDTDALVKTLADAIAQLEIVIVKWAATAVDAGGFVINEFIALNKIIGDTVQVMAYLELAWLKWQKHSAEAAGASKADLATLQKGIDELWNSMVKRGESLQHMDALQAQVSSGADALADKLRTLSGAMEQAAAAGADFVGPLEPAADRLARLTKEAAANAAANKAQADADAAAAKARADAAAATAKAHKDAEEAAKKWAAALDALDLAGKGYLRTLATLDGEAINGVKYYLSLGVALDKLATYYGLTDKEAKAIEMSWKDEQTALKENEKELDDTIARMDKFRAEGVKAAEAIGKDVTPALRSMGVTLGSVQLGANQFIGFMALIPDYSTRAAQHMRDLTDTTKQFEKELDTLAQAFALLGQTTGGALGTVTKEIANIITSWNLAVKAVDEYAKAEGLAAKAAALVSGVAAVGQATSAGSTATRAVGGAITGAEIGNAILPGLGAAIGGVAGALTGLFRGFASNAEKEINPVREAFVQMHGGLANLNAEAARAGVTLTAMLNAKNADQYKKAIDALNAALQTQANRDAFIQTQGGLDRLTAAATRAGTELTAMLNARTVDDYQKAIDDLNAKLKFQDDAMQTLDQTAQKYGLSLQDLGPAWQAQELDKKAQELYKDYQVLNAAGVDQTVIIGKMGDSLKQYVQDSAAAGVAIPESMRPVVEQMVAQGLLLDENGNKITDVAQLGVTFSESMTSGFKDMVDAIHDLTDAIKRGLGLPLQGATDDAAKFKKSIDDIPKKVEIQVLWVDANGNPLPPGGVPGTGTPGAPAAAAGGLVTHTGVIPPQYLAAGGMVAGSTFLGLPGRWKTPPSGTDTVPVWLTPGEIVLTAKQQRTLFEERAQPARPAPVTVNVYVEKDGTASVMSDEAAFNRRVQEAMRSGGVLVPSRSVVAQV